MHRKRSGFMNFDQKLTGVDEFQSKFVWNSCNLIRLDINEMNLKRKLEMKETETLLSITLWIILALLLSSSVAIRDRLGYNELGAEPKPVEMRCVNSGDLPCRVEYWKLIWYNYSMNRLKCSWYREFNVIVLS